jgi:hypothetical protein
VAVSSEYRVNIIISSKDQSSAATKKASSAFGDLTNKVMKLAIGYISLKGAQEAIKFVEFGARVERASGALNNLAIAAGTSGEEIISSIQKASDMTIDRMTAMEVANRAMLMGVAQTPAEFARLTEHAVKLGRAMGQDAVKSINDFVTAGGRQSKLIADNLGLLIDNNKVQDRANKLMAMDASLTEDAAKKKAFLGEMLDQAEAKASKLGDTSANLATTLEKVKRFASDLASIAAEELAVELGETTEAIESVIDTSIDWNERWRAGIKNAIQMTLHLDEIQETPGTTSTLP